MNDISDKKIMVSETILQKNKNENDPITWKDIKHIEFQDDDIITASYQEGFYSDNNSYDPFIILDITRMRLETDDEYIKRQEQIKIEYKFNKERRYQNFLKLKKEFEP
jgi:hypothetical protein